MRILTLIAVVMLCSSTLAAEMKCDNPFKGQKLTQAQFNQVYKKSRSQKQKINLCGTDLSGLKMSKLDLRFANFSGSDLSNVNLNHSDLSHATLLNVYLRWASLDSTSLFSADMRHASLQEANLHNADLRQANLYKTDLNNTDAQKANFTGADLEKAYLGSASLTNADMAWANLTEANLENANMMNVNLGHAKLVNANLFSTNLTNSKLIQANLQRANLNLTNLKNTNFFEANLEDAFFQPLLNHHPDLIMLATTKHFRTMRFHYSFGVPVLTELRSAYLQIGMRQMERTITAMLKVKDMHQAWQRGGWGYLEGAFSYILFYITSDFGAHPGRALQIFAILILLFSIPYFFALLFPNRHNRITLNWLSAKSEPLSHLLTFRKKDTLILQIAEYFRLLRLALFFSVLSAFQIGWRELNIGNWISRLQLREYQLRGKGWVRILAGSQSLMSAYLIVLWALTYFGRPFQW